ncbi:MAG: hypothetical protein JNL01_05940 [Bdellovibrionales bacterium]|nr:hypothetical protein [Bdellovibrionales bacterium]
MKIGLVLDNPKRDLNGLLILTHELLKYGHQVFIIPMYLQGYDFPWLELDGIVLNYMRPGNAALVKSFHDAGTRVYVLDTEGGILSSDGADAPENWAKSFRASGFDRLIDGYFFWGTETHAAFQKLSGMKPEQLKITGCPRYDFCHPKWSGTLKFDRSDFVLINTNFSAINPKFSRSPQDEKRAFFHAGWPEDYVDEILLNLHAVFPKYLETIRRLAIDHPKQTFLIRPHPFENEPFYQEKFRDLSNVVVDGRGDVLNVISRCRMMLHLNCGSSVETLLLAKPPVSMEFLNTAFLAKNTALPSKLSICAHSYQELSKIIQSSDSEIAEQMKARSDAYEKYVKPWFWKNDGMASIRVAEAIDADLRQNGRNPQKNKPGFRSRITSRANPSWAQTLQAAAMNFLGSRAGFQLRVGLNPALSAKFVTVETVQDRMNRISRFGQTGATEVRNFRHPLHRLPLSTIQITKRSDRHQ